VDNTEPKWKQILHVTSNAATVNFLFLLCCIPIVTIGQAWCGLYSAIRYAIRGDGWFSGFKAGIKTRFLRGVIAWTVCMAVDLYMAANVITMAYYKVDGYIVPLVMSSIFLLIALMFTAALIPVNVYLPGTVMQWLKNAVTLTFTSPLQMIAIAVMMWIPVAAIVLFFLYGMVEPFYFTMVFLLVYFALCTLIATILLKDPLIRLKNEMEADQQEAEET
jgi:hypothetical protein